MRIAGDKGIFPAKTKLILCHRKKSACAGSPLGGDDQACNVHKISRAACTAQFRLRACWILFIFVLLCVHLGLDHQNTKAAEAYGGPNS